MENIVYLSLKFIFFNFMYFLTAVIFGLQFNVLINNWPACAFVRFDKERRRCNYVTPTSYLELILTFKSLLKGKKDEILNLKTRYEMGLGKLEFASSQVAVMQNQLTALRPQLLETSDETEKLMIKIEQDTIQVHHLLWSR